MEEKKYDEYEYKKATQKIFRMRILIMMRTFINTNWMGY